MTRRFENVSLFDDTPPVAGPVVAEPADRDLVRTAQKLPRSIYLGFSRVERHRLVACLRFVTAFSTGVASIFQVSDFPNGWN